MTYVRRVYDIYKKRESSKQKSPDSNARTPLRESLMGSSVQQTTLRIECMCFNLPL